MRSIVNTKDNSQIALVEEVKYITVSDNGTYLLCGEEEARGVSLNGTPYSLLGTDGLPGIEDTVMVIKVDGGTALTETNSTNSIVFVRMAEKGDLDDVTIMEHSDMFQKWEVGVGYVKDNIVRYEKDGKLYRCLQDHSSQPDWTPDVAVSMWVCIADPAEEWPEWAQPVGAHDAYQKGDKVSHKDKHWTSDIDGNVWEPGVYGWVEAEE